MSDLNSIARKIIEEFGEGLGDVAEMMAGKAKHLCPKESGELENSIEVHHEGLKASVSTNSGHAAVEEFGSHDRPAHAYLRPGFDTSVDPGMKAIANRIKKVK